MDKEYGGYTYTQSGLLAIERMKVPFAATWVDLEIIILSEINQRKINII